jgi:hypothetical protein
MYRTALNSTDFFRWLVQEVLELNSSTLPLQFGHAGDTFWQFFQPQERYVGRI